MDQSFADEPRNAALIHRKSWRDRPGETITVRTSQDLPAIVPSFEGALVLRIPEHWKADPPVNIHAAEIEREVLKWFSDLGFDERSIEIVRTFAPGRYAGGSSPLVGRQELSLIARYLSLWLLWDDEDVESRGRGFQLQWRHLVETNEPPNHRFDRAWQTLFRELALVHSPARIQRLLDTMHVWSTAALVEARGVKRRQEQSQRISFTEALQSRIATIGMYATAYLVEYAHHVELPQSFHNHDLVRQITTIANKIVGLGNDLLSLAKDFNSGYVNVVLVLADELAISLRKAIQCVARMHDVALLEFDRLAKSLPSFGPTYDAAIQLWLRDLRYACLGFTLWEAAAPRYTAFKLLANGAVIEPRFEFAAVASGTETEAMGRSGLSV